MSEWTQERIDDFLKGYAMFGDTEACEAGNEIIRLRARIADLEAAGDAIRDEYIYTTRRDDIDEDLLLDWFHAKGGE